MLHCNPGPAYDGGILQLQKLLAMQMAASNLRLQPDESARKVLWLETKCWWVNLAAQIALLTSVQNYPGPAYDGAVYQLTDASSNADGTF